VTLKITDTDNCGALSDFDCAVYSGASPIDSAIATFKQTSSSAVAITVAASVPEGVASTAVFLKCTNKHYSDVEMVSKTHTYSVTTRCGASEALELDTDNKPNAKYVSDFFGDAPLSIPMNSFIKGDLNHCDTHCEWSGVSTDNKKYFIDDTAGSISIDYSAMDEFGVEETDLAMVCKNIMDLTVTSDKFDVTVKAKCDGSLTWDKAVEIEEDYSSTPFDLTYLLGSTKDKWYGFA